MIPSLLALFDGLLAIALAAAGIVAAHFYLTTPFLGFQLFALGFLLSILGFILGLIGIAMTRSRERAAGRARALSGTALSLVVLIPVLAVTLSASKYPAINDITTDFDSPPEFTHAVEIAANRVRDMKYDKSKYASLQLKGYGVLGPLIVVEEAASAFEKVKAIAAEMPDWQITSTDPATGTLEGVATSRLFHFHDDFVIQVRSAEGGKSLIEMRSKSRDGVGDLGANYRRIESFFDRLKAAEPKQ